MFASWFGKLPIVERLISYGAQIDLLDQVNFLRVRALSLGALDFV